MEYADALIFGSGKPIDEVMDLPIDKLIFWVDRYHKYGKQ